MCDKVTNLFFVLTLCACTACLTQAATRIIYVDAASTGTADGSSWANACKEFQDALTAAVDANTPVEVRVAAETYKPRPVTSDTAGKVNATFPLVNGVALKGGYAGSAGNDPNARDVQLHATTLYGQFGDAKQPLPARSVVTASGTDATAVIDGFTLTGGSSLLYFEDGHPTVVDCVFEGTAAHDVEGHGGPGIVLPPCRFAEASGGAVWLQDCNCVMAGCTIAGQVRRPVFGTVYCSGGSITASDCTFTENRGCVIYGTQSVDLTNCSFTANGTPQWVATPIVCWGIAARGCRFIANTGWSSGAIDSQGNTTLVDCEFIGNTGRWNAGAVYARCDIVMANGCIFAGNSTKSDAGGIYASASVVKLSNCTFVGNRGSYNSARIWSNGLHTNLKQCIVRDGPKPFPTASPGSSSEISVAYSDIQGGWPGKRNIDADPILFGTEFALGRSNREVAFGYPE